MKTLALAVAVIGLSIGALSAQVTCPQVGAPYCQWISQFDVAVLPIHCEWPDVSGQGFNCPGHDDPNDCPGCRLYYHFAITSDPAANFEINIISDVEGHTQPWGDQVGSAGAKPSGFVVFQCTAGGNVVHAQLDTWHDGVHCIVRETRCTCKCGC